nr:hypothetical protein [Tanacetum cinerariifolium]
MWKAIERLKQGESVNVQDLETNLYWEFGKFTSQDGATLESYYSRFYKMMNELIRNQCKVTNHQVNVQFLLQLQPEWQRENVGSSVMQKSGIQCYNCKEFGHEEAGIQLNVEQADWRDDTDNDELEDQELEAHYMYMAQLQWVSPDAADSGPIFDDEPLQKVSTDDHYNVFAMESTHPEQSKSVHETYPIEQDAQNVIIDSLDMSDDREENDQNNDDNDLAKERELLASLIEKLKCEIDESKNRNKFLETSNKVLIVKLKELARRNSMEYASQMELECAKVRGDLLSYKMDYHKSCNKYTETVNALNQTISEMKTKLSAHQETISILSK